MAQRLWTFFSCVQAKRRDIMIYLIDARSSPHLGARWSRRTNLRAASPPTCFSCSIDVGRRDSAHPRTGFARTRDRRKRNAHGPRASVCDRLQPTASNLLVHLLHGLAARPKQRRLALRHHVWAYYGFREESTIAWTLYFGLDL